MPLKLDALIAKKEAALAAETDPDRRLALSADLLAAKKTKKEMDDDEDECEPGSTAAAEKEESEKKEAAKKKAAAASLPSTTSTLARTVAALTGETDEAKMVGALQGLVDKANGFDALQADVEAIKSERKRDAKEAAISAKLRGGFISAGKAEWLRSQSIDTVTSYLKTCTAKLFNLDGDEKVPPRGSVGADGLDDDTRASIDAYVKAAPAAEQASLRADLVKAHLDVTTRTSAGSH